jgi:hypothetical protein
MLHSEFMLDHFSRGMGMNCTLARLPSSFLALERDGIEVLEQPTRFLLLPCDVVICNDHLITAFVCFSCRMLMFYTHNRFHPQSSRPPSVPSMIKVSALFEFRLILRVFTHPVYSCSTQYTFAYSPIVRSPIILSGVWLLCSYSAHH